jgi:hypothetical protein
MLLVDIIFWKQSGSFAPNAVPAYSSTNKVYGDLEDIEYLET